MAPQSGIEPPYYALRPLRLINSQVSYQLEYRGINLVTDAGVEPTRSAPTGWPLECLSAMVRVKLFAVIILKITG